MEDLEKMLRHLIGDAIELTIVRGGSVGRVKADAGLLGQVLLNLAVNARDATPDGGRLTVTTSHATVDDDYARSHAGVAPGAYALLSVSDTGTGMTDDVKARLFQPFFTTKAPGKGTGLGLATCATVVNQCGGHIDVSSEVGRGSAFTVYLPVAEASPGQLGGARRDSAETGGRTQKVRTTSASL